MAGRRMAFQLSEFEYREALKLFIALANKKVSVKDHLAAMTDEKQRDRLSAALLIAVKCNNEGTDPLRVRKIVCWRNDQGKPGMVEAQISKVS